MLLLLQMFFLVVVVWTVSYSHSIVAMVCAVFLFCCSCSWCLSFSDVVVVVV